MKRGFLRLLNIALPLVMLLAAMLSPGTRWDLWLLVCSLLWLLSLVAGVINSNSITDFYQQLSEHAWRDRRFRR